LTNWSVRNVLNSDLFSEIHCLPPMRSAEDATAIEEDATAGAELPRAKDAPADKAGWGQAPSRPLDETRRRSDMSRRQRQRGDHDRTRASHRTRFGSSRTTRCACPSPRLVRRRPSAAFLLGGTTGTVRRLCLGWRALRRSRVQRTMNQLRRMRRRCLVLRECRSRRGRRTAARLRCGGLPGGRVGLGQRHSVGFLGRSCDRGSCSLHRESGHHYHLC
jgi:hypothetical protein